MGGKAANSKWVSLTMPVELFDALMAMSRDEDMSRSAMVRQAIIERCEAKGQPIRKRKRRTLPVRPNPNKPRTGGTK